MFMHLVAVAMSGNLRMTIKTGSHCFLQLINVLKCTRGRQVECYLLTDPAALRPLSAISD